MAFFHQHTSTYHQEQLTLPAPGYEMSRVDRHLIPKIH